MRGLLVLRDQVRLAPKPFGLAVGGSVLYAITTVASSAVLGWVVDNVVAPRFTEGRVASGTVIAGILAILAVGVCKSVGIVMRRLGAMTAQAQVQAVLRGRVIDKYLDLPLSFHRARPTGELLAHADGDAEAATGVLAPLPWATGILVLLVVTGGWLVATDPFLGVIGLVLLPSVLLVNVAFERRLEVPANQAQERYGDLSAVAYESIDGALVVKTLGAEGRESDRFAAKAESLREAKVELGSQQALLFQLLDALPTAGILLLLVVGAWRVDRGIITPGTLIAFVNLLRLVTWPLHMVGWVLGSLPRTVAGNDRVQGVLRQPVPPASELRLVAPPSGVGLDVRDLHFSYGVGAAVLDGVSFCIPQGCTAALVGATGAGKSTLMQILGGLLDPASGTVSAPTPVALAFQEPFVFADSAFTNISLGTDLTEADVARAARIAQADEFLDRLPRRYDSVIGERGATLSGGQRQRLALARALVRRPQLLLLDDATSSVDPSTEADILRGLSSELAATTTLIVASRPSTIALAELVLFLDGGRIAASGTHAELLVTSPGYARLVQAYEQDRVA